MANWPPLRKLWASKGRMPDCFAPLLILFGLASAYLIGRYLRLRAFEPSTNEVELLAAVGGAILGAELDVDDLCDVVYRQAGRVVDTRFFQLGLFEGPDYVIKVWVRAGEREENVVFEGAANEGIIGWVRRTGQSLLVRDFSREMDELPAQPSYQAEESARSGIFVPLLAGGEVIGVIGIQSMMPAVFGEDDLRMLNLIASQAAAALRNAQYYREARTRSTRLRLIGRVTEQISAIQPLPDLFRQIVDLIQEVFGYYVLSIFIVDDEGVPRIQATAPIGLERRDPDYTQNKGLIRWAALHGETAHAPDVSKDDRYLHSVDLHATRSEVAVPLKTERRVLGVLDVQSDRVNAFDREDIFTMETLARQLSIAIQEAQNYDKERRQARRLALLAEAGRITASFFRVDDLLDRLADITADHLNYDRVHLYLVAGERVVFRAGTGVQAGVWALEGHSYGLEDKGTVPEVARTGETAAIHDVKAKQNGSVVEFEDTRTRLAVPLRLGDSVMGVIDLHCSRPRAFTPEDVTLIETLADTVVLALRNASFYAIEQRRRVLAETLRDAFSGLSASLDIDSVLENVLSGLERVIDYRSAIIFLLDEANDVYHLAASWGPDDAEIWVGYGVQIEEGADPTPHLLEMAKRIEQQPEQAVFLDAELRVRGRTIGYVIISRKRPHYFAQEDVEIVNSFATQAAIAIENAQLYMAQQEETWVSTALLQVAEAVNFQVDAIQGLESVARLAPALVGVGACGILEWDEEAGTFDGVVSYGLGTANEAIFGALALDPDREPFLDVLIRTAEPTHAGRGSDLELPEILEDIFGSPLVLGIPLVAKGELVGAMLVDSDSHTVDQRQLNILTGIAYQAALALETADLQRQLSRQQRLEQELEVARQIQESFLPGAPPALDRWQIGAYYHAARQVGGDFYDFIPLGGKNDSTSLLGIVVADVADKGVPAALFMALSRTLLRAVAPTHTESAAETLMRMNHLLLTEVRSDLFVTIWYGILDARTGLLRYANAGHNPPVLLRADSDEPELIRPHGITLGVIEPVKLKEYEVKLGEGDLFVLYTDGLTDALNEREREFGMDRFCRVLTEHRDEPAVELTQTLQQSVARFVGDGPTFDDLTLVMIKRMRRLVAPGWADH